MWLPSPLAIVTTSLLLVAFSSGSDGTPEASTVQYKATLGERRKYIVLDKKFGMQILPQCHAWVDTDSGTQSW